MVEHDWQTILVSVPSKSNCYKIIYKGGHPDIGKKDALKKYEDSFYMQVGKYRNMNIPGFFEYHCRVFYPSKRSDLDNSLKVQLDCLQHTNTIKNDNNCVKIVAEKFIDKDNPRVEFKLIEI